MVEDRKSGECEGGAYGFEFGVGGSRHGCELEDRRVADGGRSRGVACLGSCGTCEEGVKASRAEKSKGKKRMRIRSSRS